MGPNGEEDGRGIRIAEVVLPCDELHGTLAFFREELRFRLDTIYPADDPRVAILSGHGLRIRLERDRPGADRLPSVLRVHCDDLSGWANGGRELTAPNGTRIELVEAELPPDVAPAEPGFLLSRGGAARGWNTGRAGMSYRDLIPGRQGGRFIASHIRIEEAGPVPDDVHFHEVRFQLIYCHRGWVRVVYEDQGPPFVLNPGDSILQPPLIRHRVMESSDGLEVIEVSSPAEHPTHLDHELALPTDVVQSERSFGGQRFVRHIAAEARWHPWSAGFEARDLGIAAGTAGLAGAHVARPTRRDAKSIAHDGELFFAFVLRGDATLRRTGEADLGLCTDDAFLLPSGSSCSLVDESEDLSLLVVTAPARTVA